MSGPAIRRTLGARESTVSAELLIDLLRYLNALQLETAELAKLLDTHTKPSQPNARIPGAVAEHFWEQAVRLTGDADFGLHCAENFNPGALNILGYVLLSCRTAQEALGRLARYAALLNDGMRVRLEVRGILDARVGSELVEIYRTARTSVRNVPAILDLRKVQSMEEAGHDSIELLQAQGMFVQRPVPAPEPTCWLSVLRSWMYTLVGVPQPELAPEPCRIRARFTRK